MDFKKDDAKFFINKQDDDKKVSSKQNIHSIILFLASMIYGLLAYVIITLGQQGYQTTSMIALYAYGLIGGIGLLLVNRFYTRVNKSRQILTEVLEKSAEARAITDPNGDTIYTNKRFDNLIGERKDKNIIALTKIFKDPERTADELNKLRIKAAPNGSASTELFTNKDGKDMWIQITCQHIIGWQGYIHWRFDNITGHYEMEEAIREEKEKLRDFTDNAPVGFFSVNEEGIFTFANDTLLELLEIDSYNLINKCKLHEFLVKPPKDSPPYNCFTGKELNQQGELVLRGTKGKESKVSITHSITQTSDNSILSRSVVHDLTTEQKMQHALKASEDKFQLLFEEAPVGICILNEDMRIIDINKSLTKIFDAKIIEIVDSQLIKFINEDDADDLTKWIINVRKKKNKHNFIEVFIKDHPEKTVQLYAHNLQEKDNIVLHFIDLTERKKLERQFSQSQKMQAVGQLAGGIAHDFNNLLTAMIGFADLLLLRHKPGDPSFNDIMQIKQNSNRAANMVRQLLAFSRQQTLKPKILDLTDVLSELSHLIRRLIGVNIDLNISHTSDQEFVKADQGQIEQVLINLAVNARDAMPKGGKLNIITGSLENNEDIKLNGEEVLPEGNWVTIEVTDNGTGIDSEVLSHIFEPFFSTKAVGSGTGLGLATVHGIVHQTGGFLAVDSKIDKGSTFTIYLPFFERTEEDEEEIVEQSVEKTIVTDLTGSATILLVEDETAVRIFSTRALSNKGYVVVDAPNGPSALELMKEKKVVPDLLITDVMMPEMDGTTLAKKVQKIHPDIKIIFISGYAEDRFKEHVGGNAYFLPKPFTLKQLASRVKEVIES